MLNIGDEITIDWDGPSKIRILESYPDTKEFLIGRLDGNDKLCHPDRIENWMVIDQNELLNAEWDMLYQR